MPAAGLVHPVPMKPIAAASAGPLAPRAGWIGLVLCGALALPAPPAGQTALRPREESLDDLLEELRERYELPALAGAIVAGDEVVALGAVGRRRVDREIGVTASDLWHLGSCTKSMTATWIALLVEDGVLEWGTTLGEVYPELREEGRMHADWADVSLELLLSNRGGAPHGLGADGLWGKLWRHGGTPVEQRRALVEGVLARPPEVPPGTKYVYSNAGFSIAAAMAETVIGESWEERIERDLFQPLGMASAGFGAPGRAGEVSQPFGHRTRDGKLGPVELGPGDDNPSAIAPAGKVHCCLRDWAKYAALHLRGARGEGELLERETFERLHAPHLGHYASGWLVQEPAWAGERVLWHNGSNTMWYCELAIVPGQDCAILVASNRGDGDVRKAVGETLRRLYRHHLASRER